ncbi:hypothetical protein ACLB1G_24885 [Oxalobacteraceae bacterium A2-2]
MPKKDTVWTLVPASQAEIDAVRARCRDLVRKRALLSAGVAAVPIPGLDVVSDLRLFVELIEDINREFGLTEQQIERLHPRLRILAYQAAVGAGSVLIGKVVTRQLVWQLIRRSGVKMLTRQAGKLVPLAGQVASAALGYAAFRKIGDQHVEACAAVAGELLAAGAPQAAAAS